MIVLNALQLVSAMRSTLRQSTRHGQRHTARCTVGLVPRICAARSRLFPNSAFLTICLRCRPTGATHCVVSIGPTGYRGHPNGNTANRICLWYNHNAEEAAAFYSRTFPDSAVGAVQRSPTDFPDGKAGDVLVVEFTVLGLPASA